MICYGSITIADHFLQYGFFCIAYICKEPNTYTSHNNSVVKNNYYSGILDIMLSLQANAT